MKKNIFLSICILMVIITLGCEYKTKERDLEEYINFRFQEVELEYSEVYNPNEGNYNDGSERYTYKVLGATDVIIDDEVKEKFQVYEFNTCKYDECEKRISDNYDYVYSKYLLDKYNEEHKDNPLYLNINTDTVGGKYFIDNVVAGVTNCSTGQKISAVEKQLDDYKEYINSKTKKQLSFKVQIYCDKEEKEYSIN